MYMKLMIMPNSLDMVKNMIDKYDAVMIGIENLSINMPKYYSYEEFKEMYDICKQNGKEVFVALNKNMHNKDLDYLKEIMFKLEYLDVSGIMYYDVALVNIKLENNLKTSLVWGQEHLTTNAITSNFWNSYGADYTLVSSEITSDEVLEMQKESKSKLIVTVFGHLPMFVSERHLVKNYLKTFDLKDNSEINYIENSGNIYPIIDNDLGTISYSSHVLNGINEVLKFREIGINYILLNPFLISDNDFKIVLDLFNSVNGDNIENYSKQIEEMFNTDYGFFNKETIYKVKKND
ncbi:MAG: hypothetical protein E7169_00625 [Firmicutes bacterium]|nr:hypothetical protein [Bacillota bacterium]